MKNFLFLAILGIFFIRVYVRDFIIFDKKYKFLKIVKILHYITYFCEKSDILLWSCY